MSYPLPATATLDYAPATGERELTELLPDLDRHPFWCASLMLGRKCDKAELFELLRDERVFFWRISRHQKPHALVGFLVHSRAMHDDELSVYFPGTRDESVVAEALDNLASEIFLRNPKTDDVYAALPLPLPAGAEDALTSLGYIFCESSTDMGLKKSFYLERQIHKMNHDDPDA